MALWCFKLKEARWLFKVSAGGGRLELEIALVTRSLWCRYTRCRTTTRAAGAVIPWAVVSDYAPKRPVKSINGLFLILPLLMTCRGRAYSIYTWHSQSWRFRYKEKSPLPFSLYDSHIEVIQVSRDISTGSNFIRAMIVGKVFIYPHLPGLLISPNFLTASSECLWCAHIKTFVNIKYWNDIKGWDNLGFWLQSPRPDPYTVP